MNYTEQDIDRLYRMLDFDPDLTSEYRIKNNLDTGKQNPGGKWCLKACLAVGACLVLIVFGMYHKEERIAVQVVTAPAWLLKQADFSAYEAARGELLVSATLRGYR